MLAVWGASRGSVALARALNEVHDVRETRPWWLVQAIGLTITIAHAAPPDARQRANWLPAPEDRFFLCLRAYLPRPQLLDGRYRLPDPHCLSV